LYLNKVIKQKAIVFLISDFQGEELGHELAISCKHFDMVSIAITDPREKELPKIGYIELEDAETGEFILVDSSNPNISNGFKKNALKLSRDRKRFMRSNGIDYLEVETDTSYIDVLIKFFREREKRFR
jgi:hypothetical protein